MGVAVLDIGGNSRTFWQRIPDKAELPPGWREIRPGSLPVRPPPEA